MSAGEPDVLIIGAGPTGLVLALWLRRLGRRVRIVDKTAEPGTTSRALAVQARTLELYDQAGIAQCVVDGGRRVGAANFWVAGKHAARAAFGVMGEGISPFPFALIYPQDEHERMLIDRLNESGVEVERQTEFLEFQEQADRIVARLKLVDGSIAACEAAYIAGCDGAHSPVRETLGIGFPGAPYEHLFYVADVDASGEAVDGEIHVGLDANDFLAVFPLKADGHVRLVGTVRPELEQRTLEQRNQDLTWDDVSRRVIEWMHIDAAKVNWFSTYRVHHRVADRFRKGRAFLLGDAAHIHSPVGGQGMNTGIGDAVNLAWKLAAVIRGRAAASLLDTYEPERIAFARRLVETTDQAFTAVTSSTAWARFVRLKLTLIVIPMLFKLGAFRRLMFRTVSQANVNYRQSSLSEGRAGSIHGGDRLPWVKDAGNFAPLTSLDWQVHVYDRASAELQSTCAKRKLPLHAFPWTPPMDHAGLERDAVYLVRPDGYVGLAVHRDGSEEILAHYLDAHGLSGFVAVP